MKSRPSFLSSLVPSAAVLSAWALHACSTEPTNFKDDIQTVQINLTVQPEAMGSGDATAAGTTASSGAVAPEAMPSQSSVDSIFEALSTGGNVSTAGNESLPPVSSDTVPAQQGGAVNSPAASTGAAPSSSIDTASSGGHGGTDHASGGASGSGAGGSSGSGGSSSANSSGNSGGTAVNTLDRPTASELTACARIQGVTADRIKIVSDDSSHTITAGSVVAIKLSGNRSRLALNLGDDSEHRIAGLCLFASGHQSQVKVHCGLQLDRLVYIGRGDQSRADIEFSGNGHLGHLAADLSGNRSELHVDGVGSRTGDAIRLKGSQPQYTCH